MKKFNQCLFFIAVLMFTAQSVCAACAGLVYFKAPRDWTTAYVSTLSATAAMTKGADGYYVADLATILQDNPTDFFSIGSGTVAPLNYIDSVDWNVEERIDGAVLKNQTPFRCPGMGETLFIYENPAVSGKTVASSNPPNVKYFYVMLPNSFEEWNSATPMISMDGGLTGVPLRLDPDRCGWFYHVFYDEMPTDNVLLFRDDDVAREDMIGLRGNWESSSAATPIPLNMFFDMVDTLFFVSDEEQLLDPEDEGFYYSFPEWVDGQCSYYMSAVIYDTDPSLHPAFSCYVDGGMGMSNFAADCQRGAQGVSATQTQAAVKSCLGVRQGLVDPILGPDKKPRMSGSSASVGCFLDETFFNQMFNNTPMVNEMSCFDIPFHRAANGYWEFDSDYNMFANGVVGGFFPIENISDEMVLVAGSTPLPAARIKHVAEGPGAVYSYLRENDPVEKVPLYHLLCNGPGWNGGIDCNGLMANGDDLNGTTFLGTEIDNVWCWGGYCMNYVPADWPAFYQEGTETVVTKTTKQASPRWTSGNPSSAFGAVSGNAGRNQHFCMESHAVFTYKKGLRFDFGGNDDIWVYIGGKLAVDLGGTHMSAPGYVNVDLLTDAQGRPFAEGLSYDLDVFFCNRRSTMSSFRMRTNAYPVQKNEISVKKRYDSINENNTVYELCYSKSGNGSCAAALSGSTESIHCCGAEIASVCGVSIDYVLVQGRTYDSNTEILDPRTISGFNLSDPSNPVINKKAVSLPPGLWTLFAVMDGKAKKIETFSTKGNVDVVYGDAVAIDFDENNVEINRRNYNFVNSAMGGPAEPTLDDMIPVYISAIAGEDAGKVVMQPIDARGVSYTLDVPAGMSLYRKDGTPVLSGEPFTVGESGVDTLYAYVSLKAMRDSIQTFELKVSGSSKNKPAVLTFYLPILSFVDSTGTPIEPGKAMLPTEKEHWVGQYYPFYLQALKPLGEGKAEPCDNCNFSFSLSSETSPRIEVQPGVELKFEKGKAEFTARSRVEYQGDNFAKIVVIGDNPLMSAECWPLYFRAPPVPTPVLADVFDVNGADAAKDLVKMADTYKKSKYLDGIGDSVAIYFHRDIHKDSLPLAVCIMWDSVSATAYNPIEEGWSNLDSASVLCNAAVKSSEYHYGAVDASGYCGNRIEIGGLSLSDSVKTSGTGYIIAYVKFIERSKEVRQGFKSPLTDRIAPVPVSATIVPQAGNENYSNLTIVLSEPVKLLDASNLSSLDFYLNSASDDANRMMSPTYGVGNAITSVGAATVSAEGSKGKVSALFCTNPKTCPSSSTPQEGDYVRLGGNIAKPLWSDHADIDENYSDEVRPVVDVAYYWNSPTGYNDSKRLPTPWVVIEKGYPENVEYAEPSFRIKMVAPFKFAIVFDENGKNLPRSYALYDMKGAKVSSGTLRSAETIISAPSKGTYIVRAGLHNEIVKFK